MKRGYFVTGTDTAVGKTFVTCALAGLFKEIGLVVGVMKPIESGCPEGEGGNHDNILIPADAMKLKLASGSEDSMEDICPYRFAMPVSPNIAAREATQDEDNIELTTIKQSFDRMKKTNDIMLVEGAGGFMTPITSTKTMADLAFSIGLPLIIVAASKLGVLNHTLLTVAHARSMGLKVAGIILNHPKPIKRTDESIVFNKSELARIKGIPLLGELPFIEGPVSELMEIAKKELDPKKLV